jgi:type VI secretion system protein ImpA
MAIDVAAMLAPISADSPCGPPVEYEPQYIELETLARGVSGEEDADGKIVREAQPPNWREVERVALELCAKSKDLRVAIYLARAELALAGLPGFRDGLKLIHGYLSEFWPSVHPQLDPGDDNDPSIRVNAFAPLRDNATVLRALRLAPLTQSRQFGRLCYRDFAIATGLMPMPTAKGADPKQPDTARIEAAFADTAVEALQETQQAVAESLERVAATDAALSKALGAADGPDFAPLQKLLGEIKALLDRELAKRGDGEAEAPEAAAGGEDAAVAPPGAAGGRAAAASGTVRNRDDVLLLLDRICLYYTNHEPSSPVPLILNRTKRLVTMSFLDILKDLTPGGVQEFGVIAGITEQEKEE